MTLPTISYKQGWQTDCDDTTDWDETEDGNTGTVTVRSGTFFRLNVSASVGNKIYYVSYPDEGGADNISISSTVYTKARFRYITDSSGIKAKIMLVFSDATTQTILDEIANQTTLTVGTADITSGKTIDHIRLYANGTTGNVWYEFIMLYTGDFTFPFFKRLVPKFPMKIIKIEIPGSDTDTTQHLGRGNAEFTIEGTMQHGETWGSLTGALVDSSVLTYGEFLYQILRERYFQWLTTDLGNFKVMVVPEGFEFIQDPDTGQQRGYVLKFIEYEAGDTSDALFNDPAWYGINQ